MAPKKTLGLILIALFCTGCAASLVKQYGKHEAVQTLQKDTTWEGVIEVRGAIFVPAGVTLLIRPGTIVRFAGKQSIHDELKRHDIIDGAGIKVEGRILAKGTASLPIFFTSAEVSPARGDWDKLLINKSRGSVFSHCFIEYADYGFHAHFAEVLVEHSTIRHNNEGFRLGESRFTINRCRIEQNFSRGINFRTSQNLITNNLITGNGVGIFLYEGTQASTIARNNITDNRDYGLRLGDFHSNDVKLHDNWWGTADGLLIAQRIWDGADEPGTGLALVKPRQSPWELNE